MKRRIIANSVIACLALLSFLAGCKDSQPKIYNKSKALIVLNNAEGIFYNIRDDGSIQLSYKIKEDYPASSALTGISTQLKDAGWTPIKEDVLNSSLPSSHVKGWSNSEDLAGPPTKIGYSWMGSWEDKYGNMVTYILMYHYPKKEKQNLSVLKVTEIYMPASLINLIKQELKKQ